MRVFTILSILCLFARVVPAQERLPRATVDTAALYQIILLDPGISLGKPTLLLPESLRNDFQFDRRFFSVRPTSSAAPPPFLQQLPAEPIDIMLPLRLQMAKERQFQTVRAILGAVEIGGVAYLAYEHIRKHGFLK